MKLVSGAGLGLGFSLVLAGCVSAPSVPVITGLTAPVELAYVLDNQIWLYDAETDNHAQLPVSALTANANQAQEPALLANGEAVIFVQMIGAQSTAPYYELIEYTLATQTAHLLATHDTQPTRLQLAPNGQYVSYIVEDTLYLNTLGSATSTRLHEGAINSAWSPNSRRIVYSTADDRILSREFDVTGKLTEPETLLEQAASALTFKTNQELLFVGAYEDTYTILEYQLNDATVAPVTSLRFTAAELNAQLRLDASGERILYTVTNSSTGAADVDADVWLIYLEKDLSKALFEQAAGAVWSNTKDTIYYQTLEPTTLTQSTVTALNRSAFVPGGSSLSTTATLGSNPVTP